MARWLPLICLALVLCACGNNQPPQVLPIDAQTAYVGSRFELKVLAYDPEGETLVYSFTCPTLKLDGRAKIIRLGASEALFNWTPLANDVGVHQIDFSVSDGQEWDAESVTVTVKPGTNPDTAPVFRKPLGEGATLDLSVKKCIKLEVEVEDPDSTKVDLRQQAKIPGSTFKATGAYRAMFSWCPTAAQAAQQRHVLKLSADDHDNPPVVKSYTILIRSDLPSNCPGAAPVVKHTAPAPTTTLEDIRLSAVITDDKGLKGKPLLYHATKKPSNLTTLDYSKLNQVTMSKLSPSKPNTYTGFLPNPVKALTAGQSVTVYYVVVAEDDDDSKGNCDHRTQSPAGNMHSLKVTRPATKACKDTKECPAGKVCDKAGACVPDTCTPTDTNGDKLYWEQGTCPAKHICPQAGPAATTTSHCAKSCSSDSDCQTGNVCKVFDTKEGCGKAGTKVVGQPCTDFTQCKGKGQCLPWAGGYCSISDCDSDGSFSGACPGGSACIPVPDKRFKYLEKHWLCLQLCKDATQCRAGQGYKCVKMQDDKYVDRYVCK